MNFIRTLGKVWRSRHLSSRLDQRDDSVSLSLLILAVNLPFNLAGGKNVAAGVVARCYVEPSKLGFDSMVVGNCRKITPLMTCLYT